MFELGSSSKAGKTGKVFAKEAIRLLKQREAERIAHMAELGLPENATREQVVFAERKRIEEMCRRIDEGAGSNITPTIIFMYGHLAAFLPHSYASPQDLSAATSAHQFLNELVNFLEGQVGKEICVKIPGASHAIAEGLFEASLPYLTRQNWINDVGYPLTLEEALSRQHQVKPSQN